MDGPRRPRHAAGRGPVQRVPGPALRPLPGHRHDPPEGDDRDLRREPARHRRPVLVQRPVVRRSQRRAAPGRPGAPSRRAARPVRRGDAAGHDLRRQVVGDDQHRRDAGALLQQVDLPRSRPRPGAPAADHGRTRRGAPGDHAPRRGARGWTDRAGRLPAHGTGLVVLDLGIPLRGNAVRRGDRPFARGVERQRAGLRVGAELPAEPRSGRGRDTAERVRALRHAAERLPDGRGRDGPARAVDGEPDPGVQARPGLRSGRGARRGLDLRVRCTGGAHRHRRADDPARGPPPGGERGVHRLHAAPRERRAPGDGPLQRLAAGGRFGRVPRESPEPRRAAAHGARVEPAGVRLAADAGVDGVQGRLRHGDERDVAARRPRTRETGVGRGGVAGDAGSRGAAAGTAR